MTFYILSMGFMGLCGAISCKKDIALSGTDKELYEMAKKTSGYTWFQYSDVLQPITQKKAQNFR